MGPIEEAVPSAGTVEVGVEKPVALRAEYFADHFEIVVEASVAD
jgi:hypothetical protein